MRYIVFITLGPMLATVLLAQDQTVGQRVIGGVETVTSATLGSSNAAVTANVTVLTGTCIFSVLNASLVGTVTFEGTTQATSAGWVTLTAARLDTGALSNTVVNPDGTIDYAIQCAGLRQARVRVSAYTSGSTTGYLRLGGNSWPTLINAVQSGTWNIGSLTSITNALPAGTNVLGHVITDSSSVTNATLSAETTKVVGTVRALGNAGAIFDQADGSAVPANAIQIAGKGSGNSRVPVVCDNWKPFSIANTTVTKLVALASTKKVYICSIDLVVAAASNVALIEGTKVTNECDTSTAGLAGGTTAGAGWNLAANGGLAQGTGIGVIAASQSASLDVCIVQSASTQLSGVMSWTQF